MASVWGELRRRNVVKVAVAYAIVGWLLIEAADLLLENFGAPDWVVKAFTILVFLGFPLALIFAWAFELTPQGIKREAPDDAAVESPPDRKESTATPATDGKSIAVLPFENLSRDPANELFTIGVHDDLVTQISKIGSIKTISRTSVMQYRETTKTIPQIAAELNVATVLEGGIQKVGDRVHVNVQLIDAATDLHLWADTYDRQLTAENIFAIQGEIATSVAKALDATLSREQKDRLASVPTKNMAALEAYFVGRQNVATRTALTLEKAVAHFEQAIELDPDFALAYVGLADALILQTVYSDFDQNEMAARTEPLIYKALELDSSLGEAYTSLGGLRDQLHDYEAADKAFKRALELNPNYATAYHWYGELLIDHFDRVVEASAMAAKALELDPLSCTFNINQGVVHDVLGDFDAALAQYHHVIDIDPAYAIVYPHIGFIYWEAFGDLVKALPWFTKGVELSPGSPNYPAYLGLLYLDLGDDIKAEHWIEKAIELGPAAYRPNVAKALLALHRGDHGAIPGYAAKAMACKLNVWWGWAALAQLRNDDLRAGRTDAARARCERALPALASDREMQINRTNYQVATDYALVIARNGEQQRSDELLERCLAFIRTIPRLGQAGYWIADAAIYALRGNKKAALTALREAIDQGWRASWWYYLKHDPNFDAVRDEAEFRIMVDELTADMAAQLARVREMEMNGVLEPVP